MTRRKQPPKEIDWAEVRAAQKRGKYGRSGGDDRALCQQAWKADPERYGAQEKEVHAEIFDEVTLGGVFGSRGKEG